MENGLSEMHLISLPSEVTTLNLVGKVYHHPTSKSQKPKNGTVSGSRTPSPTKKCREFLFIDEGVTSSSSSSATSTEERKKTSLSVQNIDEKQNNTSGFPEITFPDSRSSQLSNDLPLRVLETHPSPQVYETTPVTPRRLPTVVVLGYQRVVAESQAAAEKMQQHNIIQSGQHGESKNTMDCPLTLKIDSGEILDHGVPLSPHGRNNRLNCSLPDELDLFSPYHQPPPPQSSPTEDLSFPSPLEVTSPNEGISDNPFAFEQPQSPGSLSASLPSDTAPLWHRLGTRHVPDDVESVYHQPPKAADRGAAYRLARRLFMLDGFKITDVAKHLCKRNDFSQLVGEEFVSFFDFSEQSIDTALRHFMTKFALTGETQERERILFHFSRRYVVCNPDVFVSEDACHTLVCALMLLNTDLHTQSVTRKITCQEFVNNLMDLNNAYSEEELMRLYDAFKREPLRWPVIETPTFNLMYGASPLALPVPPMLPPGVFGFGMNGVTANGLGFIPPNSPGAVAPFPQTATSFWPTLDPTVFTAWTADAGGGGFLRPVGQTQLTAPSSLASSVGAGHGDVFIDVPKDISAKEYMRGFVMRKCVMESHRKRTTIGRRSWKLFYARLRDLMLYLYKDADTAAVATRSEEMIMAYMKQIYWIQLHYQHVRFYQEQQQRMHQVASLGAKEEEPPIEASTGDGMESEVKDAGEGDDTCDNRTDCPSSVCPTAAETVLSPLPLKQAEEEEEAEETQAEEVAGGKKSQSLQALPSVSLRVPLNCPPSGVGSANVLEQQQQQQQQQQLAAAATAFQPPPPPPPPPPPEAIICIAHAYACVADDYCKKPNVFRLTTKDGSVYLMQVNDSKELEYWVDRINYAAGLLSAPSLPSAVGSDQTFHRPLLPNGVTHLPPHEQLESHQKCILDLTRDLTELKRRRMSAPSQPNLTYLPHDLSSPSPALLVKNNSSPVTTAVADVNSGRHPPSRQLPYIPDCVLKSLQPSSAATLPASAAHHHHHSERILTSAFSTTSLGRRHKKSFSALRASSGGELTAQRAELDERMAFLEGELIRYKAYSRLLEMELHRLQRLPQQQQLAFFGSPQIRGVVGSGASGGGGALCQSPTRQICGPSDLTEEPSSSDAPPSQSCSPPGKLTSLPPLAKRNYSPSYVVSGGGGGGGFRQPRSHRSQYRQYQLQRQQYRQQFYNNTLSTPRQMRLPPQQSHVEENEGVASPEQETVPASFYEVL